MIQSCLLRVRIPNFARPDSLTVKANGKTIEGKVWGNYLELGPRSAGELVEVGYPLTISEEDVSIGNEGRLQFGYKVTWKGDTVVKMEPAGPQYSTGYSQREDKNVPVYYGTDGPGPLYQRSQMLQECKPTLAQIHLDDGSLDLWHINTSK